MQSKSTLGIALTLIGVNGATFATCGYMMSYLSSSLFLGSASLSCILLMAGYAISFHTVQNDDNKNPARVSPRRDDL